jgi:hypothetical protein
MSITSGRKVPSANMPQMLFGNEISFEHPGKPETSMQMRKQQPLLEALRFHRDAKCLDSRDMIFGLRSFAPVCCQECNPVDYLATPPAICRRLFEHHIDSHKDWHFGYEGLIIFTREVYEILLAGMSQEHLTELYSEIEDEVGRQSTQGNPMEFKLKTFATSFAQVQWVSPPLQNLSAFEQILDLFKDLKQEFSRRPISATVELFLQEDNQWEKLVAAALPKVECIDRSCSFRVPDDFKYDSAEGILKSWKDPPTSSVAPQALLWKDSESKAGLKVLELSKLASRLLQDQKSGSQDSVLFIASGNGVENDMIGFAPAATTPQNLVYKLGNCRDETAIVSNFARTTKLVGMAAPLIDPYEWESMHVAFLLCIQIDIETLQILSTTKLRQAASKQTID